MNPQVQTSARRFSARLLRTAFLLGFLAVAGASIWGVLVETNRVVLERVTVRLPNLPPEFDGFRIVLLSDLELGGRTLRGREIRALEMVGRLAPDAVCIAGDLADGPDSIRRAEAAGRFLRLLEAPEGVWLVRGNRDLVHDPAYANRLIEVARESGARLLTNEAHRLARGEAGIYLAGVDFRGEDPVFLTVPDAAEGALLRAGPSRKTVYAYYRGPSTLEWRNYEIGGRFRSTSGDGGVGVGVYDRLPEGVSRHYRLHYYPGAPDFSLYGARTSPRGESLRTQVRLEPDLWYRFRMRIQSGAQGTRIEARVWADGAPEPDSWQATAFDDDPGRPTGGTVSFWAFGPGFKEFDDLIVRRLGSAGGEGVLLAEDFEDASGGSLPPGWIDFGNTARKVEETLRGVPAGETTILLVHSPDLIRIAAEAGADLVLAGHTHGGQIRLPGVGALYTRTELGRAYSAGLFEFPPAHLYVGRGLGTSYIPLRLFCPPEVTLIRLER